MLGIEIVHRKYAGKDEVLRSSDPLGSLIERLILSISDGLQEDNKCIPIYLKNPLIKEPGMMAKDQALPTTQRKKEKGLHCVHR